ncbi:hypothetical protein ZIOFF_030367 [Zingiber officinale]|uniref:Uncharacterized protein n=1 Tax=Zingiber officinale TaxID=94328 RepID=A0A8J5GR26_ZINOF|nr:hypothetical protein ZIOFF_030367 [Zingiber officinale]
MRIRFPIVIKLGYSQLWGLATFHPLLRGILLQAVLQRLLALETYLPPLRLKGLSLVSSLLTMAREYICVGITLPAGATVSASAVILSYCQ